MVWNRMVIMGVDQENKSRQYYLCIQDRDWLDMTGQKSID